MSYRVAKECFQENLNLTGGAQRDPVNYNLYNGLANLTIQLDRDISDLSRTVADLQRKINDIQYAVGRLR